MMNCPSHWSRIGSPENVGANLKAKDDVAWYRGSVVEDRCFNGKPDSPEHKPKRLKRLSTVEKKAKRQTCRCFSVILLDPTAQGWSPDGHYDPILIALRSHNLKALQGAALATLDIHINRLCNKTTLGCPKRRRLSDVVPPIFDRYCRRPAQVLRVVWHVCPLLYIS
ncbi:hypothetical protein P280DRAFT_15851 [Massarina eburnea CBS 473.64]|uniref:Uncharacterized protein n=1 Tax=Massarina eburnea CBS 473.64 TaxID=1395130 RepID=A0A6A6SJ24_9PLEO|nr:hypothetical protein P280DRAFT_15851 [Massarina eburnea CBS 473.64]